MKSVADILANQSTPGFSIEVLPPIKGKSINQLFADLDKLTAFHPLFVNITTHHSEPIFLPLADGNLRKMFVRRRPGTVAVASAIQNRYNIPVVPHIICSGFSPEETEYVLIDLDFLGIHDLFLLRGDNDKETFVPKNVSHQYASQLIEQVNNFNSGKSIDGSDFEKPSTLFTFGVAGYPEKHAEAPNLKTDIDRLKQKVDMGADYVVTQLFYDNQKFYRFVDSAMSAGISVPIIPGLKPLSRKKQLSVIPSVFGTEIPQSLVESISSASDDNEVKKIGQDFLLSQADDLIHHGVNCVHFYTLGAVDTICNVLSSLFK